MTQTQLLIALAVAAALAFFAYSSVAAGGGKRIDGETARRLVSEGARLVDVRTPGEFRAGHIEGALNIPVDDIGGRAGELEPKDKPVVLYCRTGRRSAHAAGILEKAGFTRVYDLGPKSAWR